MKSLFIIRHAKAKSLDYNQDSSEDILRQLAPSGHTTARQMATLLRESYQDLKPTLVSSPAHRTVGTAQYFLDTFQKNTNELVLVNSLYEASLDTLFNVVLEFNDNWETVFLFGHNPSLSYFASKCDRDSRFFDLKPASIVQIDFDVTTWKEASYNNSRVDLVLHPE